MIDSRIIAMLESSNVEERKQAIKALAKTKDSEALAYLADVVRNDDDDAVRELARKAGIYIRQNTTEPEPPVASEPAPLYEEPRAESPSSASLFTIEVSAEDVQRGKSYLQQATSAHMRNEDHKAIDLLIRALRANHTLAKDDYTIKLAATVTGLPGDEAIEKLAAGTKADPAIAGKSRTRPISSPVQGLLNFLSLVAAVALLVGYLVFPWIDLWSMEDPATGMTAREAFDEALAESDDLGTGDPMTDALILSMMDDLVDAINLDPTGMETTNYAIGAQNIIEFLGFFDALDVVMRGIGEMFGLSGGELNEFSSEMDAMKDEFNAEMDRMGIEVSLSPQPANFSLVLVPMIGMVAIAITLLLAIRISLTKWAIMFIVGIIGMIPIAYFYLTGLETLITDSADLLVAFFREAMGSAELAELGAGFVDPSMLEGLDTNLDTNQLLAGTEVTEMLGLGFYISAASTMALVLLPLIAMILIPEDNS